MSEQKQKPDAKEVWLKDRAAKKADLMAMPGAVEANVEAYLDKHCPPPRGRYEGSIAVAFADGTVQVKFDTAHPTATISESGKSVLIGQTLGIVPVDCGGRKGWLRAAFYLSKAEAEAATKDAAVASLTRDGAAPPANLPPDKPTNKRTRLPKGGTVQIDSLPDKA